MGGPFEPLDYAHVARVEEGNPVPLSLVLNYLERARRSAKTDGELRALRNAASIVMRSETRKDVAGAIFGHPAGWEYDVRLPSDAYLGPDLDFDTARRTPQELAKLREWAELRERDMKLRMEQGRQEALKRLQAEEERKGWRQLIKVEIRAAICEGATRYKEPVASLHKNARVLIAAIAGYIGSAVGFQAAIVAALVASVAHLIFRLGKEAFCASFEIRPPENEGGPPAKKRVKRSAAKRA